MPIYTYYCKLCGKYKEKIGKITDPPPPCCRGCVAKLVPSVPSPMQWGCKRF